MSIGDIAYLFVYTLTVIYFVILGCIMLAQRGNPICTRGELVTKRRITRSVGVLMFVWAISWIVYLPPMMYGCELFHPIYKIIFLATLAINVHFYFVVMRAILQKKDSSLRVAGLIDLILLVPLLWFIVDMDSMVPVKIGAVLSIACVVYFLIRYWSDYHCYVNRIQSEYCDISGREIFWSWSCFIGFAIQVIVYVLYSSQWNFSLECIYQVFTVTNASYLCYSACRQKPIDIDVVEDIESETIVETIVETIGNAIDNAAEDPVKHSVIKKNGELADEDLDPIPFDTHADFRGNGQSVYSTIERKLEIFCEGKLLFLDPDLTREALCRRLSISGTYLKLYFRRNGQSFYQYINTLRVEYAVKLLEENPRMPIRELCTRSGFRSQTTLRKMFKEVMGCLPSEYKK